jgi:Asp-tRNA(Asn)/Glu-tRNA(Gln) amidotransferase A subunit family amidase
VDEGDPATDVDRAALETIKTLGIATKEVTLPIGHIARPADSVCGRCGIIRGADAEQSAWPAEGASEGRVANLFRQARFLSAVDFVQADRLRRKVALEMARIFKEVDVLLVPSLRDERSRSRTSGHPSLTLRAGFVQVSEARSDWAPDPANPLPKFNPPRRVPHGITLVGRLFDDGLLGRIGMALERAFGVSTEQPAL